MGVDQELEENDGCGEQVGAGVRWFAQDLLGSHVIRSSENPTSDRQLGAGHAGNAEIEYLGAILLREKQIAGFDIAMDDAMPVRVAEGLTGLDHEFQLDGKGNCGALLNQTA